MLEEQPFFGVLLVLVEFLGVWSGPRIQWMLCRPFIVSAALAGDCSVLQKEENVSLWLQFIKVWP